MVADLPPVGRMVYLPIGRQARSIQKVHFLITNLYTDVQAMVAEWYTRATQNRVSERD